MTDVDFVLSKNTLDIWVMKPYNHYCNQQCILSTQLKTLRLKTCLNELRKIIFLKALKLIMFMTLCIISCSIQ